MITSFNLNNVLGIGWAKKNVNGLDLVWFFRRTTRKAVHGKLLIWLKHDQIWTESDSALLLFVVIDLNG